MKLVRSPITSVFIITCTFVSLTIYQSRVLAQFTQPINIFLFQKYNKMEKQKSTDFSENGRPSPGNRTGSASRSPCPYTNPPLTALMPIINRGKTVAERPTFWFYVPYSSQQVSSGEFVLQEVQGEEPNYVYRDVYQISFTLPKTPGLVSFKIPATKPALEIDKKYSWSFKLYCQPQEESASDAVSTPPVLVQGLVQRVKPTPELERQLKAATEPEYSVYTSHFIWYDAVDSITKLRITQPANAKLTDDWINLFKLKGIEGADLDPQKLKQPIAGSVQL